MREVVESLISLGQAVVCLISLPGSFVFAELGTDPVHSGPNCSVDAGGREYTRIPVACRAVVGWYVLLATWWYAGDADAKHQKRKARFLYQGALPPEELAC